MSLFSIAHEELKKSHEALINAVGQRLSPDNVPSTSSATSESLSSTKCAPDLYLGLTQVNAAIRFPHIALWDQQDYKKAKKVKKAGGDVLHVGQRKPVRGSARMNEGENVMLDFIELDDGTIVDGNTAKLIRDELRSVYNELKKKDLLPKTWGAIGITARTFVFSHIYAKFPYLLLCHNDWKIIAIAGPVLSQWWNAENKRLSRRDGLAIKTEDGVAMKTEEGKREAEDANTNTNANANKRRAPDSPSTDEPVSKRQQVTNPSPYATPLGLHTTSTLPPSTSPPNLNTPKPSSSSSLAATATHPLHSPTDFTGTVLSVHLETTGGSLPDLMHLSDIHLDDVAQAVTPISPAPEQVILGTITMTSAAPQATTSALSASEQVPQTIGTVPAATQAQATTPIIPISSAFDSEQVPQATVTPAETASVTVASTHSAVSAPVVTVAALQVVVNASGVTAETSSKSRHRVNPL